MRAIFSMTGFASVQGATVTGQGFVLSIKSVNHRFLDLQFRLPGGLDALEMRLRQMLKERLRRGHVDVTLVLERAVEAEGELRLNEGLLGSAVAAYRAAATRYGVKGEPDLMALLRLPGVLTVQHELAGKDGPELELSVTGRVEELLDRLQQVRAEEGAALAAELRASMGRVRELSGELGELRAGVGEAQFERLRSRLGKLLEGVDVDQARLVTEAALLAERSDVEEENVRLLTHVDRFVAMLDEGGELGKRLDFLLQEMNREANTMLSKTGGAAGEPGHRITEIGLALKLELERAREQVQNLE